MEKKIKRITREELNEILEKHQRWLATYGMEGERANLRYTDLRGFNLTKVSLRYANLEGANLEGVDLSGSNLRVADLFRANLRGAKLRDADLRAAYLFYADLSYANLSGADLAGVKLVIADLSGADLRGVKLIVADLTGADLRGADLRYTDLSDANLSDANLVGVKNFPNIPMACPSEGSFIGWKTAGDYIVKLEIPADAKRSSGTGIKCRCNKAKVLAIENADGSSTNVTEVHSDHDSEFIYKVGETVTVDDFDNNRFNECAHGIHFYMDRSIAVHYC